MIYCWHQPCRRNGNDWSEMISRDPGNKGEAEKMARIWISSFMFLSLKTTSCLPYIWQSDIIKSVFSIFFISHYFPETIAIWTQGFCGNKWSRWKIIKCVSSPALSLVYTSILISVCSLNNMKKYTYSVKSTDN